MKIILLGLLTSINAHVCNVTFAFADKEVALFESRSAKMYDDGSFLTNFWYIPEARCESAFEQNGWQASTEISKCSGFKRAPGSELKPANSGKFSALPVFETCELASAFSSMQKCLGSNGKYVPLGIVTHIVTRRHGSVIVHHSV